MEDISGGNVTLKEGEHLNKERTPEDVKNDAIIKIATEMYNNTSISSVLKIMSREKLLTRTQSYILLLREWPDFVHLEPAITVSAIFLSIIAPNEVDLENIDLILSTVMSEIPKKKGVSVADTEQEIKFIMYRYWKLLRSLNE